MVMIGYLASMPGTAQEPACPSGSACATTSIDGKQLPPPPFKFEGKIDRNAPQSKPYWPPRIIPPKGALNLVLIVTDDLGFGVPSTFGGVILRPRSIVSPRPESAIPTSIPRHWSSPTRAALITGRNHRSVGFGVIAGQATGFPRI